jgi:hypothetical protein
LDHRRGVARRRYRGITHDDSGAIVPRGCVPARRAGRGRHGLHLHRDYFGSWPYLDGSGNTFPRVTGVYTTADRITGSFTVAEGFVPLPNTAGDLFTEGVLRYAFTDGHQTLTEANSTGRFHLALDLAMWAVAIGGVLAVRESWPGAPRLTGW